ncbi:MAG TPA: PadR family transcriptional regulator [Gemmatimonadaceae bacterium]|nr:PadR family transcriptional regulator [Gemmatimonadaceae bacterium]
MAPSAELLPGNLELVILKAISLGDVHGYGVLLRIEQISGGAILVQQGALYPALCRLEHKGVIAGRWGTSTNNRRARFYQLTALGRRQLAQAQSSWQRLSDAIALSLTATPQGI